MGQRERAAIGRKVEKKLASASEVTAFTKNGLNIFFIKNFLSADDIIFLKDAVVSSLEVSRTLGDEHPEYSDFRTSSTSQLWPHSNVVKSIDARISDLLGIDPSKAEATQGQHYAVDQTFRAHCDFFHMNQKHWKTVRREGGQRVWTAMAYLNDDMEGGETKFIRAGFTIRPVAGMLVLWNNMTNEGQPNWLTLHEGAPVKSGEKIILTKWYRERDWRPRMLPQHVEAHLGR